MLTDSFFQQGATHDVCEDYAVHGNGYAIVSDGCSNGGFSINSDWGSRILRKCAEKHLPLLIPQADNPQQQRRVFFKEVMFAAKRLATTLPGLSEECMTASLLLAVSQGDMIRTLMIGDGVVGGRRSDGSWWIRVYETPTGAPFYLKYMMYSEVTAYFDKCGDKYRAKTYTGRLGDGMMVTEEEVVLNREHPWFGDEFPASEYNLVFVGSDGFGSFYQKVNTGTSKHNEPVGIFNALEVMFDGTQRRPGFLRLQRNWAFKRATNGTFLQRQWHNADDCALGAIHL